jgi:Domain of unknown function (DUF4136)
LFNYKSASRAIHPFTIQISALFLIWTVPCLAQSVKTDYDKSVDFSKFHHYEWRDSPEFEKQPDLKTRYAVGIDLVRSAVNKGLMAKGYVPVDFTPDFYVTLFLGSKGMTDVTTLDMGWYTWGPYWYPMWTTVMVSHYTEGTLILDIVDAKTNKLAWRAFCHDDIRDPKQRHENVERAVKKALKKFPPK